MGKEFSITPREVPHVQTKHRRIATAIPHPDSVPTLERLRQFEPQSMRGQHNAFQGLALLERLQILKSFHAQLNSSFKGPASVGFFWSAPIRLK